MSEYLQVARDVYAAAAQAPDTQLCCVSGTGRSLPGLVAPAAMLQMNYGCGSAVEPSDLAGTRPVLYIGVGGGLEALQLAYFRRWPGGVIAVDPVEEMRARAQANLEEAARLNPWFRPEFVRILNGTAASLPVAEGSVDLVAQNCLFNIFMEQDLRDALREVHRVLRPGGLYSASDPVADRRLPAALGENPTLRARCISGCVPFEEYVGAIGRTGFGRISIRARRPYRLLLPIDYAEIEEPILLESIDLVAEKSPGCSSVSDGPSVSCGRYAIYRGREPAFRTSDGQVFPRGTPLPVNEARAAELTTRADFLVSPPSYGRVQSCC